MLKIKNCKMLLKHHFQLYEPLQKACVNNTFYVLSKRKIAKFWYLNLGKTTRGQIQPLLKIGLTEL